MKKIFLIIGFGFLITSCDISEQPTYSYVINPVFQVDMPTAVAVDSVTNIPVRYKRPSSCHIFNKFYYEIDGMNRTVGVENLLVNQSDCHEDNETVIEMPLKFSPIGTGTFHFKFWTGGNQYLEYDVVVDH